ncbi:hypothetical protein GCM10008020_35720 [Massilia psychrophila]|uniref:S8 family serine peptidase n=2 Tax=Massilia psychrophila TaxID=1603353 RepID=UPI0019CD4FC8|nr:S8 family serine peptidase [Massilia psychrophila]GGE87636.1 hypothetical protein GCM10008020_35720 [Massilia psychrophila]
MKPRHTLLRVHYLRSMLALTLAASAGAAHAQLRLPSINLPSSSPIGGIDVDRLGQRGAASIRDGVLPDLPSVRSLRLDQVGKLLRRHRDVLEADPQGEPVVRREILAWGMDPAALATALAEGSRIERELGDDQPGLPELRMLVLRVPDGSETATVLARLRALDPGGVYDFNHIYTGSAAGLTGSTTAGATHVASSVASPVAGAGVAPSRGGPRVGLVDSGVDTSHAVFQGARIERWGCAGQPHPSAHGTAVAALMVGQSGRFRGGAPQADLYAADIYCDSPTGGSADKIAAALAWLAGEKVAVINLSLVGPANGALERIVGALQQRGHLLVAAVGNDGPAAPPLYPASYPGVVGVSAVDRNGRTLPEAARGPQVMFAAPGNHMVSAAPGAPAFRPVRGTSFAAPLVAALLSQSVAGPSKAQAAAAIAALARQAVRADGATVSNETGYGIVGAALRIDPASVR